MMKNKKRFGIAAAFFVLLICVILLFFTCCATLGRYPEGERLKRVESSPNYRDGEFHNRNESPITTDEEGLPESAERIPENPLPTKKTDLMKLSPEQEIFVWMGHSSMYLQTGGKRFLIDPVLLQTAPVPFYNRPFKGTEIYTPDEIPDVDYLIISHDHYDHLDYKTVTKMKERIGKVICPLGVGEHFEKWGYGPDKLIEMDWDETADLGGGFVITCLTAKHYSGRTYTRNKTLWAGYLIQSPKMKIYYSGDSGYDPLFTEIGQRFPDIDLAIIENGQYNTKWHSIHLLPDELVRAAREINAKRLFTVHNSKFSIHSPHSWYEPLEKISRASEEHDMHLITPMIGETVYPDNPNQIFSKWWERHD
jgi:L-ascorbate metabolism protein UlaG (beta-lactamase superfamily)